jgi:hypothetical protein
VTASKSKDADSKPEPTIGQRFEEARELFRQEKYRFPRLPRRRSRPNAFIKVLNEIEKNWSK